MNTELNWLPEVFLRAPLYSFTRYQPAALPEILKTTLFQNALYLASPAFYGFMQAKDFDAGRLSEKETRGLWKYYNRMCFRPTPFGAFASFTLAGWSREVTAELAGTPAALLHLLPAAQLLAAWRAAQPPPADEDRLRLNPTAYHAGRSIRFVRSQAQDSGRLHFYLTAISEEDAHRQLLARLRSSEATVAELRRLLVSLTGCTEAEGEDYLQFLLEEQFLFSRQQGDLLVPEGHLSAAEKEAPEQLTAHALLPDTGLLHQRAEAWLTRYGQGMAMPAKGLFYAATERPLVRGGVPEPVRQQITGALLALHRLAAQDPGESDLERFKQAFRQRFDRQKVPLLTALDPDSGMSYAEVGDLQAAGGWIQGIPFRTPPARAATGAWTALHQFFISRWVNHPGHRPGGPIVLCDSDLAQLPEPAPLSRVLPPSLAVMFSRTQQGQLVIEAAGGATATALIGRFSAFSPAVEDLCTRLARLEQAHNPDVLFADIGQWTDYHVDNINRRRPVYPYYIPVNTYGELPADRQIALQDLQLFLEGDDLMLESVSLGKRIIPRLATAYNFRHNDLGIFRLLCDLQYQGIRGDFSLDLEHLFPGLSHYPRVEYGAVILCPAKWHFPGAAIKELTARPFSLGRLHGFRQQHLIPAWVTLGHSDQQLTFNLGNDEQALFFLHCISSQGSMVLREYLEPDRSVRVAGLPLSSQGIAFLEKKARTYAAPLTAAPKLPASGAERLFLPGSNWLYVKIYCMPATADQFLLQVLRPVLQAFGKRLRQWFFIRYTDPGPHLRLRFHLEEADGGKLLNALNVQITAAGFHDLVRDMQTDSYRRELERYGREVITDAEKLFQHGSELVLQELAERAGKEVPPEEVPFTALALSQLMAGQFLGNAEAIEQFLAWRASAMEQEYENAGEIRRAFDAVYRRLRPELNRVLEDTVLSPPDSLRQNPALEPLLRQTEHLAQLTAQWPANKRFQLIGDLIHMQLNRMFAAMPRPQEALVFHCLHKYAVSGRARRS
jgi:thiopeptide-type bacteriocin biosynthesis protein